MESSMRLRKTRIEEKTNRGGMNVKAWKIRGWPPCRQHETQTDLGAKDVNNVQGHGHGHGFVVHVLRAWHFCGGRAMESEVVGINAVMARGPTPRATLASGLDMVGIAGKAGEWMRRLGFSGLHGPRIRDCHGPHFGIAFRGGHAGTAGF